MNENALTKQEVQRWTRVGVLAALAMLLGYAEAFLPIPIPGVKLGLANIAVLVALDNRDVAGAFCVAIIKVLATGLLFGSPLTMAYSAAGTLLAFAGMAPLSRLRSMHLAMVSVVGALLHEIGQLAVASTLLGTTVVWYAAPVLMLAGCATGALCGVLAKRLSDRLANEEHDAVTNTAHMRRHTGTKPVLRRKSVSVVLILLLVAYVVVTMHTSDVRVLALLTLAGLVACALARVRPKALLRGLVPMTALVIFSLVVNLIVAPQTAVAEATRSALRLVGIGAACMAFMGIVPTDDITAAVAWLLLPLRKAGVRTEGFLLAFDVAARLVPTIVALERPKGISLRALPDLACAAYGQLWKAAVANSE